MSANVSDISSLERAMQFVSVQTSAGIILPGEERCKHEDRYESLIAALRETNQNQNEEIDLLKEEIQVLRAETQAQTQELKKEIKSLKTHNHTLSNALKKETKAVEKWRALYEAEKSKKSKN